MGIRKRKIQADYLEVNGANEFLGTGFTTLDEKPNAKTTSKRYICDSNASQSISSYEWEAEFEADQIQSDKAIEYIVNIGEMCKTGAEAETNYYKVDLDKEANTENSYRARKFKVAIKVDDSNKDNDGELQCSGSFLAIGDPVEGTFNTATKTFTEGFIAKNN